MVKSYLEAYRLKSTGEISWDEYIEHLFARCRGLKHPDDSPKYGHWELRYEDPFGYAVWRWCKTVPTMADSTLFEDVFKTYRYGTLDEIEQKIEAVAPEYRNGIRKILAFLALRDRRADVLKSCMDKGDFPFESYFEDEANVVVSEKDPETFDVLEKSRFRKIYPRKAQGVGNVRTLKARTVGKTKRQIEHEQEVLDRAARFDVGGSHPVDW